MKKVYMDNYTFITIIYLIIWIFFNILFAVLYRKEPESFDYAEYVYLTLTLNVILLFPIFFMNILYPFNIVIFSSKSIISIFPYRVKRIKYNELKYCYLSDWDKTSYDFRLKWKSSSEKQKIYKLKINFVKEEIKEYTFLSNKKFSKRYKRFFQFSIPYYNKNIPFLLKSGVQQIFIPKEQFENNYDLREKLESYNEIITLI